MVLEYEEPEGVNDRSEAGASVATSVSRLLEGHLESLGAIEREGVSSARFVNNLDILSVELGASVNVDFLVFHKVLAKVDLLLALFVLRLVRRFDGS